MKFSFIESLSHLSGTTIFGDNCYYTQPSHGVNVFNHININKPGSRFVLSEIRKHKEGKIHIIGLKYACMVIRWQI